MANIEAPTPVSIALPFAEQLVLGGQLDNPVPAPCEGHDIEELYYLAEQHGFMGIEFWVSAQNAFAPIQDVQNGRGGVHFDSGLSFTGNFVDYTSVRIKTALGDRSIRALCLAFNRVTLMPDCDVLTPDQLVYTPAFAVKAIDPMQS